MSCKAAGLITGVYKNGMPLHHCFNDFICKGLTAGIICVGTVCSLVQGSLHDLFSNIILSFCSDIKLVKPVNYIILHFTFNWPISLPHGSGCKTCHIS